MCVYVCAYLLLKFSHGERDEGRDEYMRVVYSVDGRKKGTDRKNASLLSLYYSRACR